jgi:POT family proton-dependent oligopeptide transporter
VSAVRTPTAHAVNWLGQPPGLTILFLTQMWETFSYYGMRTLLVYYMTKQLLMEQQQASLVYGFYTAMVFFTPILGGVVSDRWLGRRKAVVIGGLVMALGHFLMASESAFYFALAAIAIGNGLFLPSLPSQVDGLYAADDPRRGSAFNVYYVGTNIGGLMAMLGCGWLGETYGWHVGFGAAGIGMGLGLVIYILGARWLPPDTGPRLRVEAATAAVPRLAAADFRQRMLVLLAIGLCVVLFRAAYEQTGNTVALWTDASVDRGWGGFTIPLTWFIALNPAMVILLSPLLIAHWTRQAGAGRDASAARKMALGAFGVAGCYLMLAAVDAAAGGQVAWVWLALFFCLLTAAELFVLPVGLGLFARLAPDGHAATTIAAWFFAAFGGNLLAGVLGTLWSGMPHAAFFSMIGAIAAAAGACLWLLDAPARRMQSVHDAGAVNEMDEHPGQTLHGHVCGAPEPIRN